MITSYFVPFSISFKLSQRCSAIQTADAISGAVSSHAHPAMESASSTDPSGCLMRRSLVEIGFFSATGRVSSTEMSAAGLGSGGGTAIGARDSFTGAGVGASMGAGAEDLRPGGFWLVRRFRLRQAAIAPAVAPTISAISTSLLPSSYSCRARFSSHVLRFIFLLFPPTTFTVQPSPGGQGRRRRSTKYTRRWALHRRRYGIRSLCSSPYYSCVKPSITLHKRRAFSAVGSFRQAVLAASVSRITLAWCSESFRSNSAALAALSH